MDLLPAEEQHFLRMFMIRKTVMEMLRDRGYLVSDGEVRMSRSEFEAAFGRDPNRESLTITVHKLEDTAQRISVFFPEDEMIRSGTVRDYVGRMHQMGVDRAVLVGRKKITPPAKKAIEEARTQHHIEVFLEEELLINVRDHGLVPQHIILSQQEQRALLCKYAVKATQLPRINHDDPVAKYFGLKKGQVVK
ncbi:hypothetical protein CBR_g74217, partial [Chara braunii]